jgi:hypothetical protein
MIWHLIDTWHNDDLNNFELIWKGALVVFVLVFAALGRLREKMDRK